MTTTLERPAISSTKGPAIASTKGPAIASTSVHPVLLVVVEVPENGAEVFLQGIYYSLCRVCWWFCRVVLGVPENAAEVFPQGIYYSLCRSIVPGKESNIHLAERPLHHSPAPPEPSTRQGAQRKELERPAVAPTKETIPLCKENIIFFNSPQKDLCTFLWNLQNHQQDKVHG